MIAPRDGAVSYPGVMFWHDGGAAFNNVTAPFHYRLNDIGYRHRSPITDDRLEFNIVFSALVCEKGPANVPCGVF